MNLKVIILAAGKGSRLIESTLGLPKPLIDINGISLIQRQINLLKEKKISKITIIRGYKLDEFQLNDVNFVNDKKFNEHDQLGSLISGMHEIKDDILIIFGDILFDKNIIQQMIASKEEIAVAVDSDWKKSYIKRMDNPIELAGKVLIKNKQILEFSENLPIKKEGFEIAEFLGLIKIKKNKTEKIKNLLKELMQNHKGKFHDAKSFQYAKLTDFLQELITLKFKITPVFINGNWCEIDTPMDLELARKKFQD
jgi:choline kinase